MCARSGQGGQGGRGGGIGWLCACGGKGGQSGHGGRGGSVGEDPVHREPPEALMEDTLSMSREEPGNNSILTYRVPKS